MTLYVGADVELALHMYSSMVQSALFYNCEVWGQNCLGN
jgi:hypothetical protein